MDGFQKKIFEVFFGINLMFPGFGIWDHFWPLRAVWTGQVILILSGLMVLVGGCLLVQAWELPLPFQLVF